MFLGWVLLWKYSWIWNFISAVRYLNQILTNSSVGVWIKMGAKLRMQRQHVYTRPRELDYGVGLLLVLVVLFKKKKVPTAPSCFLTEKVWTGRKKNVSVCVCYKACCAQVIFRAHRWTSQVCYFGHLAVIRTSSGLSSKHLNTSQCGSCIFFLPTFLPVFNSPSTSTS